MGGGWPVIWNLHRHPSFTLVREPPPTRGGVVKDDGYDLIESFSEHLSMYKVEYQYESQLIRFFVLRRCDMNEQLWSIKLLTLQFQCECRWRYRVVNWIRLVMFFSRITFVALSIVLLAWKLECRTWNDRIMHSKAKMWQGSDYWIRVDSNVIKHVVRSGIQFSQR